MWNGCVEWRCGMAVAMARTCLATSPVVVDFIDVVSAKNSSNVMVLSSLSLP